MMMLLVSHVINANSVTLPESHVAHFNCLNIRNAMVPLVMLQVLHDAYANVITQPKSHVVPHFHHLDLMNAMMPLKTPSESFDTSASANGIKGYKGS